MLQDLKLPEGRVIKQFKGGPNSLKKVVDLLRDRGFSGYLKVMAEGDPNVGYVVMGEGKRALALFFGPERALAGKEALPHFREMATSRDFIIELHTDVDVEPLLRQLPTVVKQSKEKKAAMEPGKSGEKSRGALEVIGQSLANVIEAFAERGKQQKGGAEPTPEKAKEKRSSKKKERKRRKKKESEEAPSKQPSTVKPPTKPSLDPDTGLLEKMTFESFLSGESNRFAHASCLSLAEGSLGPYNPLLIVAEAGLGKTHLLNATGWELRRRRPDLRLRYLTSSRFRSELEEAEKSGKLADFRSGFAALGALLVDDIQDLKGSHRAQEVLYEIFEEFYGEGKPLVLAADRRPGEIDGLDSRLTSRFQSGLVAVLRPPDLWMRLDFLKVQARARDVTCSETVLRYLAESEIADLRGLEGALNTLTAYAATMEKTLDVKLAREALGDGRLGQAEGGASPSDVELLPSRSYLVEEEAAQIAYRLFAEKPQGVRKLLITRVNPSRLRERTNIEGAEILWLTDRPDSSERTVEPVLERLAHTFESFIHDGGPGVLMLDGVEYLKSNNGFEPVLTFIRHLVDEVSESDFTFILAVDPATLEQRELRVLEREMEVISPSGPPRTSSGPRKGEVG